MSGLFQLISTTPRCSVWSILASCVLSSGASTGSISFIIWLYICTMRSRLPVWRRKVSAFLYTSSAPMGTSRPSSRKYLTSRSRRMSAASKLTLSNMSATSPSSSSVCVSSGRLSFSTEDFSTSAPHSSTCAVSNSSNCAMTVSKSLDTSLASSRSCRLLLRPRMRAMGSVMRSRRPRHHESAPLCGGRFQVSGGRSRYSRNTSCTFLRSRAKSCTSARYLRSSSSAMVGRSSSESKESSSLKRAVTVVESSKLWLSTAARRRSNSLMRPRKVARSAAKPLASMSSRS